MGEERFFAIRVGYQDYGFLLLISLVLFVPVQSFATPGTEGSDLETALEPDGGEQETLEAESISGDEDKTKESVQWENEVGASFVSLTGNARAVTARIQASSRGELRGWASEARFNAVYGEARREEGVEVTARGAEGSLRGERDIWRRSAAYAQTGIMADHPASIEYQIFGEAGVTFRWLEIKDGDEVRTRLSTDVGLRSTRESRFQYFPTRKDIEDRTIISPRFGAALRQRLGERARFRQEIEILPDFPAAENLRVNSSSILSAQVVDGLAMQLGLSVRYIAQPAEGRVPTDTEFSAGLSVNF